MNLHVEPAIQAMEQGYTILLEDPSTIPGKARASPKAETNAQVLVAHVLRYTTSTASSRN